MLPDPDAPPIPFRAELGRKALHLASLAVPAAMLALGREASVLALAPLVALAVGGDVLRARSRAFAGFIGRTFGWMMRAEERPPFPAPVVLNGATWVLASALLLALAFPPAVAVPAFAAFMVGDAAAALVGRRFGRHRWPGTTRTLEGSAAFALTAFAVLIAIPHLATGALPPARGVPAAFAALAMAAAEALPLRVNDNLRAPLAGALALWALG